MTERDQQDAYSRELEKLTNRFANEFEMSYTSVIGCLELEKFKLLNQLINPELYEEAED